MIIKAKKVNFDGLVRLETSGKIAEVIIKEDITKPKEARVVICFRGKSSSGIVELSRGEMQSLITQVQPQLNLVKEAKILKFGK